MGKPLLKPDAKSRVVDSLDELAAILDFPKRLLQNLTENAASHYRSFEIAKRTGGHRIIEPPSTILKRVQRAILLLIYSRIRIPRHLHGGLPGRSQITHAKCHMARRMVATLDVRDFYGSIRRELVARTFEKLGFSGEALASLLALTMLRDGVPQGAPTSCVLANLAFLVVDRELLCVCKRHGLRYTRFIDDLAFSADHDFFNVKGLLITLVTKHGFEIPEHKIHFSPQGRAQIVTGLIVNQNLRPTAEYLDHLSNDIWDCLNNGASAIAAAQGLTVARLKMQLNGRVGHLESVSPEIGKDMRRRLYGIDWRRVQPNTVDVNES